MTTINSTTCNLPSSYQSLRLVLVEGESLKACLTGIFDEAKRRQSENRGSTVLGAVMQHLVGAKLETLYPDKTIIHSG